MEFWDIIRDALPSLFKGLYYTILISLAALILATVIGLLAGLMRISTNVIVRNIAAVYVNVIRGTPLLIQILFIYFGLPTLLHTNFPPLIAGIAAVSLNIGAYLTEIFRAGIESVEKGTVGGRSVARLFI